VEQGKDEEEEGEGEEEEGGYVCEFNLHEMRAETR